MQLGREEMPDAPGISEFGALVPFSKAGAIPKGMTDPPRADLLADSGQVSAPEEPRINIYLYS